jgi:hypothetical protein
MGNKSQSRKQHHKGMKWKVVRNVVAARQPRATSGVTPRVAREPFALAPKNVAPLVTIAGEKKRLGMPVIWPSNAGPVRGHLRRKSA